MTQNTKKIIISLLIFLFLVIPIFSFAVDWEGLVPCNNNAGTVQNSDGTSIPPKPCDFNALMNMINIIIKFVFVYMAVPIAAIMFFYAGFSLVTSGGSSEKRGIAKKVFTSTAFGLIIAAGAWLIIRMILSVLGYNGAWIGF